MCLGRKKIRREMLGMERSRAPGEMGSLLGTMSLGFTMSYER
jgi:hypothetical protein